MTSVRRGGFYGWPYSYFGQHVDVRAKPPRPDLVAKAIKPDYALGPHTASLGLTFYTGQIVWPPVPRRRLCGPAWLLEPQTAERLPGDLRALPDGKPAGPPRDILTGFVNERGEALGRPSVSPWTGRARCWSPTMSATRCGAWCRQATSDRGGALPSKGAQLC